jgi:hypothetical protein
MGRKEGDDPSRTLTEERTVSPTLELNDSATIKLHVSRKKTSTYCHDESYLAVKHDHHILPLNGKDTCDSEADDQQTPNVIQTNREYKDRYSRSGCLGPASRL